MRNDSLSENEVKFYTSGKVTVGTHFYLKLFFSGQDTCECRFNFNIVAKDMMYNCMYHLDFRINWLGNINQLVQTIQENGVWQDHLSSNEFMNLVEGRNDIEVIIGPDFFEVRLNGVKFKENVAVDSVRLSKYSHLLIQRNGTTAMLDLEKSYAIYLSGNYKDRISNSICYC